MPRDPRVAFLEVGDAVMLVYDRQQEPLELLDGGKNVLVQIYRAQYAYGGAEENSMLLER